MFTCLRQQFNLISIGRCLSSDKRWIFKCQIFSNKILFGINEFLFSTYFLLYGFFFYNKQKKHHKDKDICTKYFFKTLLQFQLNGENWNNNFEDMELIAYSFRIIIFFSERNVFVDLSSTKQKILLLFTIMKTFCVWTVYQFKE